VEKEQLDTTFDFVSGDANFNILDVGGHRYNRRAWNFCNYFLLTKDFEGKHGMIFVASLSEFDQNCCEDNVTNRMLESLELFKDVANGKSNCFVFE
jgi:hypothetical protein